jgi:hypothetical protein
VATSPAEYLAEPPSCFSWPARWDRCRDSGGGAPAHPRARRLAHGYCRRGLIVRRYRATWGTNPGPLWLRLIAWAFDSIFGKRPESHLDDNDLAGWSRRSRIAGATTGPPAVKRRSSGLVRRRLETLKSRCGARSRPGGARNCGMRDGLHDRRPCSSPWCSGLGLNRTTLELSRRSLSGAQPAGREDRTTRIVQCRARWSKSGEHR